MIIRVARNYASRWTHLTSTSTSGKVGGDSTLWLRRPTAVHSCVHSWEGGQVHTGPFCELLEGTYVTIKGFGVTGVELASLLNKTVYSKYNHSSSLTTMVISN